MDFSVVAEAFSGKNKSDTPGKKITGILFLPIDYFADFNEFFSIVPRPGYPPTGFPSMPASRGFGPLQQNLF